MRTRIQGLAIPPAWTDVWICVYEDGHLLAIGNDGQFARLCECLGRPELAAEPRYATMPARNANRAALHAELDRLLAVRGAEEWFPILRTAGVPAAPILDVAEGVGLAEELGLEPVALTGSGERRIPTIRHPIGFDRARIDYSQAPPRHDADREGVLAWLDGGD